MEVLRFSDLLKKASEKASDVLQTLGISKASNGDFVHLICTNREILNAATISEETTKEIGKDGELIFSKNNVCTHDVTSPEEAMHHPGYLSIICQDNPTFGCTLILQWCANASLRKHPERLDRMSPKPQPPIEQQESQPQTTDKLTKLSSQEKLVAPKVRHEGKKKSDNVASVHPLKTSKRFEEGAGTPTTSEEDEDASSGEASSSPYSSANEADVDETSLQYADAVENMRSLEQLNETPEEFAKQRNMVLPDQSGAEVATVTQSSDLAEQHFETTTPPFVADLGSLKLLRIFYSDSEMTSGQLVLANHQSQYKIFYFHNGGLDKVANIFDQWNALRLKTKLTGSTENDYLHFSVLKPRLGKLELHPEEGLYTKLTWQTWRASVNDDKIADDEILRKAAFFCGIESSLRREAWPFLLGIYQWDSTREQREHIKNHLFIEYQNLKKKRLRKMAQPSKSWRMIEHSIEKDVIRTDRDKPFFSDDDNANLKIMRDVLLNYAVYCPQVGYVQGMSDLLSPLLMVMHDEVDTFWCFVALMRQAVCLGNTKSKQCFEKNLALLLALLEFVHPQLYTYLKSLGPDSTQLLFAHRWLLLWFKREFVIDETMSIWEASWTGFGTAYFHLFVALAIMVLFGDSVMKENMKHDEVLLYFNSLALHMDVNVILTKARGLLYQFRRNETIPCTIADLCDLQSTSSWDSLNQVRVVCNHSHEATYICPYSETVVQ